MEIKEEIDNNNNNNKINNNTRKQVGKHTMEQTNTTNRTRYAIDWVF